jgi:DNA mismatch endonuclease, patch repair protein
MMAGIKGKNTKPELLIRKELHHLGYRYKLHDKTLPGKPDLVFPKYKAVIFVHGCFWHMHECHLFKWPSTREEFWRAKLNYNQEVDKRNLSELKKHLWRVCIVWECSIKGKMRKPITNVIEQISKWVKGCHPHLEISCKDNS